MLTRFNNKLDTCLHHMIPTRNRSKKDRVKFFFLLFPINVYSPKRWKGNQRQFYLFVEAATSQKKKNIPTVAIVNINDRAILPEISFTGQLKFPSDNKLRKTISAGRRGHFQSKTQQDRETSECFKLVVSLVTGWVDTCLELNVIDKVTSVAVKS